MTELNFYDDPSAFLRDVEDVLAQDPVVTTVVSAVTQRVAAADDRGEARGDHPHWWVAVREGGRVVGVAMRTAPFRPYPLYVLPMPEQGARALARALHERGEQVVAANGALPATEHFADEAARLAGGRAQVHQHMRLWEAAESATGEGIEADEMARRIAEGLVWLWEDGTGRVVQGVTRPGPA